MAFALDDRVKQTSTTTGTGTYDLTGTVTGFQTFVAGIGDGNTCWYSATDGTDWEVGIGTVTDAATDTLARTTILSSSNADAAVNWAAGTRTITCTYPAFAGLNKGFSRMQVFTATGANTWSKATGLSFIVVEAIGGGGGGGGCGGGTAAGGGGGAGGYARKTIAASLLSATETVTIGSGGVGGISGGSAGSAGGATSFGAFLTACGGGGGLTGGTLPVDTSNIAVASGGLATSGDINIKGGPAGAHYIANSGATLRISGFGGASFFGGGGTRQLLSLSGVTAHGEHGKAYGSGGGGSIGATATRGGGVGGDGKTGLVIVWEFI